MSLYNHQTLIVHLITSILVYKQYVGTQSKQSRFLTRRPDYKLDDHVGRQFVGYTTDRVTQRYLGC